MDDAEERALLARLDEILAALEKSNHAEIAARPEVASRISRLVESLVDRDRLIKDGYYTIEQAYGAICDEFEGGKVPRIKTLQHCGVEHQYHALQACFRCPICRTYRAKIRGLFGHDEIEDVAYYALRWLGIDPRTVPGWNRDCDGWE